MGTGSERIFCNLLDAIHQCVSIPPVSKVIE